MRIPLANISRKTWNHDARWSQSVSSLIVQILHDAVDASGRASIGGSGVLKARPPKMAENAHAIFAPWEWAIEITQNNYSERSLARVLSMNVRARTPVYASEYVQCGLPRRHEPSVTALDRRSAHMAEPRGGSGRA